MIKAIAVSIDGTRKVRPSIGDQVLVHDGKRVIVQHGPEAHTITGNAAYTMVTGTKLEIEAELKRLKLTTADEYVKPVAVETKL